MKHPDTELQDALAAAGGFLCGQTGQYVERRCDECAQCILDNEGCMDCEAECPPWDHIEDPI